MRRRSPDTPYLAIDQNVVTQNIQRMANLASQAGINLRPHVKTHKSIELAKLQIAAGAVGITVATIGEAEVFAKKGVKDIFIAYPLYVNDSKLRRLKKLTRRTDLTLAVDSVAGAKALALGLSGVKLLVEIDSGHHRSGCEPQQAGEIAHAAKKLGLNPVGVFTFPGHSYKPSGAKAAVADEQRALLTAVKSFRKLGIEPTVVSSGSTPSAQVTAKSSSKNSVITELRPGVYALNDAQQLELGSCNAKQIGLWAVATVVSANGNRLILDSGSKTLGADRPTWATGYGRLLDFPDARIEALSEHHATVVFPRPKKSTASGPTRVQRFPKIGDQLRVAPNHVCSAVNLVERLYLIDGKKVLGSWAVAARGRNS